MVMRPTPVAAIDLGSNTVRLLVASAQGEGITRHLVRQETTRLGQALRPGDFFIPEARERTWRVLESFRESAAALGAGRILVGATMAVRQAADGLEFMDTIRRDLGCETLILSGTQEAEVSTAGVLTALKPIPERAVVFDLGGRSTEFALTAKGRIEGSVSLPLGALALSEAHLRTDPPAEAETAACREAAKAILVNGLSPLAEKAYGAVLVGTAGTTTTLAAMAQGLKEYRPELIDNFRLDRAALSNLFERMGSLPAAERARLDGLPSDRADVILGGAAAVLEIMDFLKTERLIVSDAGLLEGIWLLASGLRSL